MNLTLEEIKKEAEKYGYRLQKQTIIWEERVAELLIKFKKKDSKELFNYLYNEKKLLVKEIADMCDVSDVSLRNYMKQSGIAIKAWGGSRKKKIDLRAEKLNCRSNDELLIKLKGLGLSLRGMANTIKTMTGVSISHSTVRSRLNEIEKKDRENDKGSVGSK